MQRKLIPLSICLVLYLHRVLEGHNIFHQHTAYLALILGTVCTVEHSYYP